MQQSSYHWYIILVRGGQEAKIIENIKLELVKNKLEKQVRNLKVFNAKDKKNFLKGYIFCYCFLTPELVRLFYSIPRIVSFLNHQRGSSELPEFISPELVENFSIEVKEEIKNTKVSQNVSLAVGDLVKIVEGTFANYEGKVASVDERNKRVRVNVDFVGRSTPVEVPLEVCQKVC